MTRDYRPATGDRVSIRTFGLRKVIYGTVESITGPREGFPTLHLVDVVVVHPAGTVPKVPRRAHRVSLNDTVTKES